MTTAKDLGMSQAEFEDAMNLEKMYMLVSKTDCNECGKTPVTYAKIGSWELLCNDCGKSNSASKIATTHFKTHEVNSFEKAINGSRRASGNSPVRRSPKRSGRKSGPSTPPIPVKKARQSKRKRYSSSSSSISPSPSPSSSSSEVVKRKSRKKTSGREQQRSRRYSSLTPTMNNPSSAHATRQRVASMPVTGAYYDPIHPPSAFPGSEQQFVGMNAIKAQEQDLMQQHHNRHNALVPAYPSPHPYDGKKGLGYPNNHQSHIMPGNPGQHHHHDGRRAQDYPLNYLVSPPRGYPPFHPGDHNENYPSLAMPMLPVPPARLDSRVRTSWSHPPLSLGNGIDSYYNQVPQQQQQQSYSPYPLDMNHMLSPSRGPMPSSQHQQRPNPFFNQPPQSYNNNPMNQQQQQQQQQQQLVQNNPFNNVATQHNMINHNRSRYPWRNENSNNLRSSPDGVTRPGAYHHSIMDDGYKGGGGSALYDSAYAYRK